MNNFEFSRISLQVVSTFEKTIFLYIQDTIADLFKIFAGMHLTTNTHSHIRTFEHSDIRTFAHSHIRTFAHSKINRLQH